MEKLICNVNLFKVFWGQYLKKNKIKGKHENKQ